MASIFDGMAGMLNGVFGDSVTWTPEGGAPQSIWAIFREDPVRVEGDDGSETFSELPTLRVQRPTADSLSWGDVIAPGNGRTYALRAPIGTGSPAADAFLVFEMELIA